MPEASPAGRCVAWLEPEQARFVRAVAVSTGLTITHAGCPAPERSAAVAAALSCDAATDLRSILTEESVDLVFLASCGEFGRGEAGADARALNTARARGLRIASMEPIPPSALDLKRGKWEETGALGAVRVVPLPRFGAALREATEALTGLGPARGMSVECFAGEHEASLGSRLFGAVDLALAILGEPESVDASYTPPLHRPGERSQPGETLAGLRGDMRAHLRHPDGRGAVIVAGDRPGRWNTSATILGENGRLRLFDDGFEWIGPDGRKVDEHRRTRRGEALGTYAAEAVADAVRQLLSPNPPGLVDHGAALATAQAALLSARTGQPESPATIRRMV